jgi:arylamine N-acetyltransferase
MTGSRVVSLQPYDADLRGRYLRHLGLGDGLGPPSPEALRVLQHAHLDRVPYENLEIQLGRPTSIDPRESAQRIVSGRGGYCLHLNGAFAALLVSLGYDVTLTRGAAPSAGDGTAWGNHLVPLVRFPERTWVVDVGLGDGFRDPFPLAPADLPQPPFHYRLEHVAGTLWRFQHDARASITGFDLDVSPVALTAFAAKHEELSTSPESPFVQKLVVQSRRADHALTLRGCVLTRSDALGKTSRDVLKRDEWMDLLRDEFGLRLDDVEPDALTALWERVRTAHEAWDRAGRP